MRRRGLKLTALLLILGGVGFYYLSQHLPSLLESRLRAELARQGVTEFTLGEPYWGLSGAGTREVTARGVTQGWDFQLSVEGVQADYHWRALLEGDIQRVSVDQLRLTLIPPTSEKDENGVLEIAQYLDRLRDMTLPVESVSVGRAEVDLQLSDQQLRLTGERLELDGVGKALEGVLVVEGSVPNAGELKLDINIAPSTLAPWVPSLELSLTQDRQPILTGTVGLESMAPLKLNFQGKLGLDESLPLADFLLKEAGVKATSFEAQIGFDLRAAVPDRLDLDDSGWWQGIPVSADISVAAETGPLAERGVFETAISFDARLEKDDSFVAVSLGSPISGRLGFEADHWQIPREFLADADKAQFDLSASPTAPIKIDLSKNGRPELLPFSTHISVQSESGIGLEANLADAAWENGLRGKVSGTANLMYGEQPLPELVFDLVFSPESEGQKIAGSLSVSEVKLALEGDATISDKQTRASGEATFDELPLILDIADKFGFLPEGVQLASGEATVKFSAGTGKAGKSPPLTVGVDASDLSGLFSSFAFSNARLTGKVAKADAWRSLEPFVLDIDEASAGVQMTNISAAVSLLRSTDFTSSRWNIYRAKASVFSGEVSLSEPAPVNYPFSGNRIAVELSNLDLEQILALYAKQGVSGSGALSGTIPLVLKPEGIQVDRGQIRNLTAGTIRFHHEGAAAITNEQVAMTMRLLENFEYEALNVTAELAEDGQLVLATRLSGRNPAEFDGRQVNFNINVEDNIFDLYKVLTLSDKLTRQLEKRIRDNQKDAP